MRAAVIPQMLLWSHIGFLHPKLLNRFVQLRPRVLTAASNLASRVCQSLGSRSHNTASCVRKCFGGRTHKVASSPDDLAQLRQQWRKVDLSQNTRLAKAFERSQKFCVVRNAPSVTMGLQVHSNSFAGSLQQSMFITKSILPSQLPAYEVLQE